MSYIKVKWIHCLQDEPVLMYMELCADRYELRKIEVFRDGSVGYASQGELRGTARLGVEPVPSVDRIAMDPQFDPSVISKDEFECAWFAMRR